LGHGFQRLPLSREGWEGAIKRARAFVEITLTHPP
jgi:hypothetical protein